MALGGKVEELIKSQGVNLRPNLSIDPLVGSGVTTARACIEARGTTGVESGSYQRRHPGNPDNPHPPINPLPGEGDGWQSLGCDHFSELPCNVTRLCINEKGSSFVGPIVLDPVFMPMTPRGPGSLLQKHCWGFNLITQPISSTMIFQIFYLAQTELVNFLLRSC